MLFMELPQIARAGKPIRAAPNYSRRQNDMGCPKRPALRRRPLLKPLAQLQGVAGWPGSPRESEETSGCVLPGDEQMLCIGFKWLYSIRQVTSGAHGCYAMHLFYVP